MQDAVNYSPQQKEALLAAQDQLFIRMHQVLEKREAIVNTLQTNFPCAETEHKNAPLYIQVRGLPSQSYTTGARQLSTWSQTSGPFNAQRSLLNHLVGGHLRSALSCTYEQHAGCLCTGVLIDVFQLAGCGEGCCLVGLQGGR